MNRNILTYQFIEVKAEVSPSMPRYSWLHSLPKTESDKLGYLKVGLLNWCALTTQYGYV